jgi:MFS family permease
MEQTHSAINYKTAIKFIVLLGVVSLFADMTYEGARGITGPYLAVLGASATVVGFVSGFGEFLGYALRLFSGLLADKTNRYWTITIVGYVINLMAVPLLGLTNHWPTAAFLILIERVGKGIRSPAKDAILSHPAQTVGVGWGFGLHEAFDQVGAILGPLIVALVLYLQGSYQQGFLVLLIPALLALIVLLLARWLYPVPSDLEKRKQEFKSRGMSSIYWLYLSAIALIAMGYADFPLVAYHFQKASILSSSLIPIVYAIAMAVDALAALVFGYIYDRTGPFIIFLTSIVGLLAAPFVFLGGFYSAFIGMALWGIGLAVQESVLRAFVADLIPSTNRGSGYGFFNAIYGTAWFVGSALMGILYDQSILLLVLFSVIIQVLSLPILILVVKRYHTQS